MLLYGNASLQVALEFALIFRQGHRPLYETIYTENSIYSSIPPDAYLHDYTVLQIMSAAIVDTVYWSHVRNSEETCISWSPYPSEHGKEMSVPIFRAIVIPKHASMPYIQEWA